MRSAGERLGVIPDTSPLPDALARMWQKESITIVQIGAYTGATENDPLWIFLERARRNGGGPVLYPVLESSVPSRAR
jgi:hypothetical protein